ncbi:hypothetical protein [Tateyamaria sp. SN3-11]|uniref:hypothetical protein n=1 Tax=Tateyamaria sp. SN3-11 TaxID=3092147 RepID=UPI0039EC4727
MLIYDSGRKHGEAIGEYAANTDTYARHTQEHVKECLSIAEDSAKTECIIKEIEASNEHERAEKDLIAQTEMALWALGMLVVSGLMLFVTAIGVWWIRDTLVETRRAVKAADDAVLVTREMGITQNRGWLKVEAVSTNAIQPLVLDSEAGDANYNLPLKCRLTNVGNGPCLNVRISILGHGGDAGHADDVAKEVSDAETRRTDELSKTASKDVRFGCVFPGETTSAFEASMSVARDGIQFWKGEVFVAIAYDVPGYNSPRFTYWSRSITTNGGITALVDGRENAVLFEVDNKLGLAT